MKICKVFHAEALTEDIPAEICGVRLSRMEEPDANSLSSPGKSEYTILMESQDINRHAQRKIEAWLNDGWSAFWEWNGEYNYKAGDSRWRHHDRYRSTHWMSLRKVEAKPFGSPLNLKFSLQFPEIPEPPVDPDSDWLLGL